MREDAQALIFGSGLPPAGMRGTLSVSITGAEISTGERHQRAPLSHITLRDVGVDSPVVFALSANRAAGWVASHVPVKDEVALGRLGRTPSHCPEASSWSTPD